ncbi:oligosaccharide flippase family protein [Limosilactobacillus reuteri]
MEQTKKVTNNVVMLYIMNITQLILPLITLPYLARVLSISTYGVVSYVKNVMIYASIIIEFGFLLSATREIVEADNKEKIGKIIGRTIQAKLILALCAFIVLLIMTFFIKILKHHMLFTLLMLIPSILTIFLLDFLFRGIEKMQIITIRYLIMKGIATVLTFVVVKNDSDILFIPFLDIIGTTIAIGWVSFEVKKMNIRITFDKLSNVLNSLRESFTYFVSNMATTAFGALNTIVVGIFLSSKDVAFWTMLMTLINAVQSLYSPISDGIYPQMIKTKSLSLFKKVLLIFTPVLVIGCLITFFAAPFILLIIGGQKYVQIYHLLRIATPLLFISFYSILCGWPLLGAIGKIRETTFTTILASLTQVAGLIILIVCHIFTLNTLIYLRIFSEGVLAISRITFLKKFKKLYN